jgi:predicted flap endonuclease-1-like 5' DNA nuclease
VAGVRRALGAVVVMGVVGLWNALGAGWLRFDAPVHGGVALAPESTRAVSLATGPRAYPFSPRAPRTSALTESSFRSDPFAFLSRAPADSLDLLPGVGPVLAGRIIGARDARGAFTSWDDVLAVKGIGPATVARWRALAGQ